MKTRTNKIVLFMSLAVIVIFLTFKINRHYRDSNQILMSKVPESELNNKSKKLSIYENSELGYRFNYPSSYEFSSVKPDTVELIHPYNGNKLTIQVFTDSHDIVKAVSDRSEEQKNELEQIVQLIDDSFEFFNTSPSYSEDELKKRFEQN